MRMVALALFPLVLGFAHASPGAETVISIETPMAPPYWALLERESLRVQTEACEEYFARYFDERGYLRCVERWGGDDGPDDAIENVNDWPLLYAIGAPDSILRMTNRAWEGHLRQYTQAKTTEVELAREGMYYKEFPVMFDWLHLGEGLTVFNLLGLCQPYDDATATRIRRYAGFYLNEDPQAANYDPKTKVIRGMFNGSRGPLLRRATALDWAGDPIEVAGRFRLGHGETSYEQMLEHFRDYNDVVLDHPQNLLATTLALNAFMLTGDAKYKDWLLEYVGAWRDRARANGDILPSKVGLNGAIGGDTPGQWYGGVYGWGFTVAVPGSEAKVDRNTCHLGLCGFGNAYLLTGDAGWLDVWRRQIDAINSHAREISGRTMFPTMCNEHGWYGFTPSPYQRGASELYYWSQDPADRARAPADPWLDFLDGRAPDYPAAALVADLAAVGGKTRESREDPTTPDTRLSDDPTRFNPATVGALARLTMGALHPGQPGGPLHCRLRYFDPVRRRAGLPADVAALVEKMSADSVTVTLVNLDPLRPREIVVQGGAYGEHEFSSIAIGENGESRQGLATSRLKVKLAPGAGARLVMGTRRYTRQPSFAQPWDGDGFAARGEGRR